MLAEAKAVDAEEDARCGPEQRGDELPEGLGRWADRLKRLKAAKEHLEQEAEAAARAAQEHLLERQTEEGPAGRRSGAGSPRWEIQSLPRRRRRTRLIQTVAS